MGGAFSPALPSATSRMVEPDVLATNGVVHIIDVPLFPLSLVDLKGTNAESVCIHHELEFFYKAIALNADNMAPQLAIRVLSRYSRDQFHIR